MSLKIAYINLVLAPSGKASFSQALLAIRLCACFISIFIEFGKVPGKALKASTKAPTPFIIIAIPSLKLA